MNNWQREHMHDYFEYNGKKYYVGTRFISKGRYDKPVETLFQSWNSWNNGKYDVIYKEGYKKRLYTSISYEKLIDSIIEILDGNYYDELEASKKYPKDSEVPELAVGWIAYAVVMLGLVIFKEAVAGWILASVIFFLWRHKKLEENAYYTKKDF